jgi:hypothetical protein
VLPSGVGPVPLAPSIVIDRDPATRPSMMSFEPAERDAVRRAYINQGVFAPPPTAVDGKYPPVQRSNKKVVRVQPAWFQTFKWLEYSPTTNKLFCLPCYLFPGAVGPAAAFIAHGFQNYKKVGGRSCALMQHQGDNGSTAHNHAVQKMNDLGNEDLNIVTGKCGFLRQAELEVAANRTRLNGKSR